MNTQYVDLSALAGKIVRLITVEMEASGRHIHLCRADLDLLFGPGYQLTPTKELSQPGQFACRERVTLSGPKGELRNVVILGPERPQSQAEISLTDAVALGITPPVRISGDIQGSPGITIQNGRREITLTQGLIVAKRHIHMTPSDAKRLGLTDGQRVRLAALTARPLIFDDVVMRINDQSATYVHLDYDEANACGFKKGDRGLILPEVGGYGGK
jgi:putative phosphotransacetylase